MNTYPRRAFWDHVWIVGYIGNQEAVPIILDGLRRLEYRGYDSAGIAVSKRRQTVESAVRPAN